MCFLSLTRGHLVPDVTTLTEKQREVAKMARRNLLRQKDRAGRPGIPPDRLTTVAVVWDDLLGGEDSDNATRDDEATPPKVGGPPKGNRAKSGKA